MITHSSIEQFLNIEPYIYGFLKNAVLSPINYISKVLDVFVRTYSLWDTSAPIAASNHINENKSGKIREITLENASDDFFDLEKLEDHVSAPSKQRQLEVLQKVKELSEKLGITKPLHVLCSEEAIVDQLFAYGTNIFSSRPANVYISAEFMNETDEVLDFAIAHELSHIAHNDPFKQLLFTVAQVAVETFTLFICPLALPLASGANFLIEKALSQRSEKQADISAMQLLNTNAGAIETFSRSLEEGNELYTQALTESLVSGEEKDLSLREKLLQKAISLITDDFHSTVISADGQFRNEIDHPPIKERLNYAQSFSNVDEMSQKPSDIKWPLEHLLNRMGASKKASKTSNPSNKVKPEKNAKTFETIKRDVKKVVIGEKSGVDHPILKIIERLIPDEDKILSYNYNQKTHEFTLKFSGKLCGKIDDFDDETKAISKLKGGSFEYPQTLKGRLVPSTKKSSGEIHLEHVKFIYPTFLVNIPFTPDEIVFTPLKGQEEGEGEPAVKIQVSTGIPLLGDVNVVRKADQLLHTISCLKWS